ELAMDEFHVAQIERVVEHRQRVTHVAFEAFDLRIETDENAAAVVVHPRHRFKAECVAVKGLAIGFLAGNALELTACAINPAVIEATEKFARALMVTAHQVAAMAASIQQNTDLSVVAVRQDHRSPGDRSGHEIAGVWEFRDMAGKQPAPIKNPRPFLL